LAARQLEFAQIGPLFCEAVCAELEAPSRDCLHHPARSEDMGDDWANCDAETVVAALSARYRFSRANAVQLLRDEGILPQHACVLGHLEPDEEDDDDDLDTGIECWISKCPTAATIVSVLRGRHDEDDDVGGDTRVAQVAVTGGSTLVLDNEGCVWAAGENDRGQLGNDGDHFAPDSTLHRVIHLCIRGLRVTMIAAGGEHCAGLTDDGQLFMWGANDMGQCGSRVETVYYGNGHLGCDDVLAPKRCTAGAFADDEDLRIAFVACGANHTVTVTTDRRVITFGHNLYGQLGTDDTATLAEKPPRILTCAALEGVDILHCATGSYSSFLVDADGRVFAMGNNANGQLGIGDTADDDRKVITPTMIDTGVFDGARVVAVAGGASHTLILTSGKRVFVCGEGERGATGLGHTNDTRTPVRAADALANAPVVRIATGWYRSCALTEDGQVFSFGSGPPRVNGPNPDAGVESDGFEWKCDRGCHLNDADAIVCSQMTNDYVGNDLVGQSPCSGCRRSRTLLPVLVQGALADTTVGVLGGGSYASHSVFVPGVPPCMPDFGAPLTFPMQKPAPKALRSDTALAAAQQQCQPHNGGGGGAAAASDDKATCGLKRKKRDEQELGKDDDEDEEYAL